jgi:hypothetical protein
MAFGDSFRAARWLRTFNLIVQACLFITLFAGLNYIALHFALRFDITKFQKRSLSAETRSYLKQLDRPVLAIVTFSSTAEDEKFRRAFEDVRQILREYTYATETNERGKIRVTYLDVFQRPREAQQIGAEQNQVILHDTDSGRTRIIRYEDLYQFREGKRAAFRGEQAITSAILDVASNERKKIYFIAGHGELNPSDTSPDRGLSVLTSELSMRNFELDRLEIRMARKIPDDAALLLIIRPTTPFDPLEEELLREYLAKRAGRVLLLIDPQADEHGLGDLLFDWGLRADRAVVWDAGPSGQSDGGGLFLKRFAKHPVTAALHDQVLPVSFGFSRPVRLNPSRASDESLTVTPLIATNDTAWGELNFTQSPPQYDPGIDLRGGENLTVAAASERVGAKAGLNFSVPRGRIVAIGCADFVANSRISASGNMTLVLSSINWLVDRDAQVSIAPRPIETFQLALSQQDLLRLRYTLLFGLPGAAALLGLLVYWTRRR